MVFTKLSTHEKDAFFGLLDEYFQSRPELFGRNGNGQGTSAGLAGTGVSTAAAASVVQHALAAGNLNAMMGSANGGLAGGGASGKSNNPYAASMPGKVDVASAVTVGRVAAASLALSGGGVPSQSQSGQGKSGDLLPTLPRRAGSTASAERTVTPGLEVDKLVTKKTSVFSAFKKPEPSAGISIPPAFIAPKNTYGPPPVRRVTSETTASTGTGGMGSGGGNGVGAVVAHVQRLATPAPAHEPESEVAEGEWAEVLYDYTSEDSGDLTIKAGDRVFVTEQASADWWTGRLEGQERQGLFPASYVKLL